MTSADSASCEPISAVFAGDRVTNLFPRHEIVKLDDGTYIQWHKQDRLLTSWLLFTINPLLQFSFTDACTACDVWTTAINIFAADTGAKQFKIRHELHFLKKGNLSIKAYVAHIKTLCALLETFGSVLSEDEKIEMMLAGLPLEFDALVSSTSLSNRKGPLVVAVCLLVVVDGALDLASSVRSAVAWVMLPKSATIDIIEIRVSHRQELRPCINAILHLIDTFMLRLKSLRFSSGQNKFASGQVQYTPCQNRFAGQDPYDDGQHYLMVCYYNGPLTYGSNVNYAPPDLSSLGPHIRPTGDGLVLWPTKPRARVFFGSDLCIGLPQLYDLNASDYSDYSGYHIHAAQFGSNCGDNDSYIPTPVGTMSWYPDSGTSNHVYYDASALRDVTPYSDTSLLLIGARSPAMISSIVVFAPSIDVLVAAYLKFQNKTEKLF
ncbi:hypothetical protein PVK06_027751 [Gossypium arboreum]|uniref:Uncharacterized protein n=1 Tax=Gossypium arboreum TaxID=29729 RepID=A0ABR0P3Q6_GOSAR|nr:hypothetical protein PVK06_027751 [Gossypium arboreum]